MCPRANTAVLAAIFGYGCIHGFLDFISSNFTYTPIVNLLSWRDIPCFCSDSTVTARTSDHILGPSHYWFSIFNFSKRYPKLGPLSILQVFCLCLKSPWYAFSHGRSFIHLDSQRLFPRVTVISLLLMFHIICFIWYVRYLSTQPYYLLETMPHEVVVNF